MSSDARFINISMVVRQLTVLVLAKTDETQSHQYTEFLVFHNR